MQGLEGNRFALISKTHHALVDGDLRRRPRDRAVRRQPGAGRADAARCGRGSRKPEPSDAGSCSRAASRASRSCRCGSAGACCSAAQHPRQSGRARDRGGGGRRRGRLGAAEPGARRAAQPDDRAAPALPLGALAPRRLQDRQGRLRRHGQRRRAGGDRGRAAQLAARAAACARPGPRAAGAGPGQHAQRGRARHARQPAGRRSARRCPSTREDPVERLRIVREEMAKIKQSKQVMGAEALVALNDFAPPTCSRRPRG